MHAARLKEETTDRLLDFSSMLLSLSGMIAPEKEPNDTSDQQMNNICQDIRGGGMQGAAFGHKKCWETEVADTYTNIVSLLSTYSMERKIQQRDIPYSFLKKCYRPDILISVLNNVF